MSFLLISITVLFSFREGSRHRRRLGLIPQLVPIGGLTGGSWHG